MMFVVQHVDYWRIPELLASGDITVGISQTRGLPANATRQVVLSVPQYSSLPALLAGTDLIAYTAEAMAASGQLFKEPFPFKTPTLDLSMVWLSHVDTDPAERWLRSRLEAFMNERAVSPLPE